MADIIWTMIEENSVHVIRLVHTYFGGQREIWLDNQLVAQGRMLLDYGSRHFVKVNEHEYELNIVTNGIKFSYFLLQGGFPVPTDRDRAKGITSQDLFHSRYLRDVSFWHDLGQALNFSYIPNRDVSWAWRHRLIGLVQGFLIVVQKGTLPKTYREGWSIIIRHSPPLSTDSGERIWADNRIAQLLGNLKKSKDAFEHNPDYTCLFLPRKKKETPVELATRVEIFLAVVALYAQPIPEGLCENTTCKQRFIGERQLISINGMPWFFVKSV